MRVCLCVAVQADLGPLLLVSHVESRHVHHLRCVHPERLHTTPMLLYHSWRVDQGVKGRCAAKDVTSGVYLIINLINPSHSPRCQFKGTVCKIDTAELERNIHEEKETRQDALSDACCVTMFLW